MDVLKFFSVVIGFGFFCIIWDLAVEVWGLSHNQVLLIFLGIALAVTAVGHWVVDTVWWTLAAWLAGKRRARRVGK
ncbi:hypothetical protein [Streptomyces antibioticus]|uniref:hypothetical protein n=1 Tax=Streptomyces antibioticus TaxID=1890 RepID=UPI0036D9B99F